MKEKEENSVCSVSQFKTCIARAGGRAGESRLCCARICKLLISFQTHLVYTDRSDRSLNDFRVSASQTVGDALFFKEFNFLILDMPLQLGADAS